MIELTDIELEGGPCDGHTLALRADCSVYQRSRNFVSYHEYKDTGKRRNGRRLFDYHGIKKWVDYGEKTRGGVAPQDGGDANPGE